MYKLIPALVILLSIGSCNTYKQIPLSQKSKPSSTIITKLPNLSKDLAWDRAVRLFADHNISIKAIDKNSGFMESDLLSFISAYQIDSMPSAFDPVYVVAQRESAYDSIIQPSYITGFIKIFILNDSGQTEVHVSIDGLKNYHLSYTQHTHSSIVTSHEIICEATSTGALESQIADYISTGKDTINAMPLQNGLVLNPKDNYAQYLKKKQNIITYGLLGGELGGAGILSTIIIILAKHKS